MGSTAQDCGLLLLVLPNGPQQACGLWYPCRDTQQEHQTSALLASRVGSRLDLNRAFRFLPPSRPFWRRLPLRPVRAAEGSD